MAQIISLVVYEINGVKLKQTQTLGFSVDNFIVSPYTGTNASLKSTIEVLSDDASKTFSVVETQATIQDLANAGGGLNGADNGLSVDNGIVELGGELTKNTYIDISDYTFIFNDGQGWNFYMITGNMEFGLTDEQDGNNKYIQITDNYISTNTIEADNNNFINIYQSCILYKITTNQFYPEWEENNQYDLLTGSYNNLTEIRFHYYDNDLGDTYQQAFQINNTKGAEGNFIARYNFLNMPVYTNNANAIANGLQVGDIYRTGDTLKIVN